MNSIPKAFNTIEKKEMTVEQYEDYLRMHTHQTSLIVLRCVECGDTITYCNGDRNRSYFKHSPTHEGHSYCSLYHEGVESKTSESLLRKRFFKEEDIALNFEMIYREGRWKSVLAFPPFSKTDISNYSQNDTAIIVEDFTNSFQFPIDEGHFLPGEVKKVQFNRVPRSIKIKISSNKVQHNISFDMAGFRPSEQLYASLLVQNMLDSNGQQNSILNRDISFTCKRISGAVYTGRHYMFFSNNPNFGLSFNDFNSIDIKRISSIKDMNFNFYLFDVVFNKLDEISMDFCEKRNCYLVEKDDATILWPPIKTIGNYRYFGDNYKKIFISFENEKQTLDIADFDTYSSDLKCFKYFFKIKNINQASYYVSLDRTNPIDKENANIIQDSTEFSKTQDYDFYYHLQNDVLLGRCDKRIKLRKKDSILMLNSLLDRLVLKPQVAEIINNDRILDAIRYSNDFILFNEKQYNAIIERFKNNSLIKDYLDMSLKYGRIKKHVFEMIMEGVN